MAELKTKKTTASVEEFLNRVENARRRQDSFAVLELMKEATGEQPAMWGASIVGFGSYDYQYASGRRGTWMATGFAPRKQSLTLYIMDGFDGYAQLLEKLGKYKTGKSCLYINRLADVDLEVLSELVKRSLKHVQGGS